MRPNRREGGLGLHPDPTSGPARASSAPRARPALRPHKLVSLLCWALLELVPLTPRFHFFFFLGLLFCGEGAEGGGFLPLCARQVSCPKAGLGAPSGRKWGRVHPRGGACSRGAPISRACKSGLCPSPRARWPLVPPAHLQPPGADTCRVTLGQGLEQGPQGLSQPPEG